MKTPRIKLPLKAVCFCLTYLLPVTLLGADLIILDNSKEHRAMDNFIDIYEDPGGKKTIDDISDPNFIGFQPNEETYPYGINKNTQSAYWIRFHIKTKDTTPNKWLISFYNRHIDLIECYTPTRKGNYVKSIAGHNRPFSERTYSFDDIVFDLPTDTMVQTIYIRVLSNHTSGVSNRIIPLKNYLSEINDTHYAQGIFYGAVLLLLLYNLLLYVSTKDRLYLTYCLYIFSAALFLLEKDSLAFENFWPEYPALNEIMETFSVRLLVVCFWLYTKSILRFFGVYKPTPWIDRTVLSYALLFLLSWTFHWPFSEAIIIHYILDITLMTLLIITVIKRIHLIGKEAWLLIIGFIYIPISFSLFFIQELDISSSALIAPSFNYGFLIEAILFSYAHAKRVRRLKDEKETALITQVNQLEENKQIRERVNKELESLVAQKTEHIQQQNQQLEVANEKLKEQAEQINFMNLQLDGQNRQLTKKVMNISRARVLRESLKNEDFKTSFPDDRSCYLYLMEQKWGDGFECTSCGHHEAVKGQKPFTKRCINCHHQESVIYNTLLQGSKMNISKAFYIIHLLLQSDGKVSSYKLEELSGVSRKTCAKLKKLVLDRIEELKKANKAIDVHSLLIDSRLKN